MYMRFSGGRERALATLERAFDEPGNLASGEVTWIAEADGRARGRDGRLPGGGGGRALARLHGLTLRGTPFWRWPGVLRLYWMGGRASPRPREHSLYIDALATDPAFRRQRSRPRPARRGRAPGARARAARGLPRHDADQRGRPRAVRRRRLRRGGLPRAVARAARLRGAGQAALAVAAQDQQQRERYVPRFGVFRRFRGRQATHAVGLRRAGRPGRTTPRCVFWPAISVSRSERCTHLTRTAGPRSSVPPRRWKPPLPVTGPSTGLGGAAPTRQMRLSTLAGPS